jgi:flavin reductase (DIM6/NTAB) family NADH-FMN oxidoreductase RutF
MQEALYQEAFHALKPETCLFVLANDTKGKTNIMTAAWSMKCSHEPPLYAVALSKHGHTHNLIQKTKQFVFAFPNKALEKYVKDFGSKHGDLAEKLITSGIATTPAKKVAVPLIKDATINFECELFKEVDCGDHTIFIGKILATHVNPGHKVLFSMRAVQDKHQFEEF